MSKRNGSFVEKMENKMHKKTLEEGLKGLAAIQMATPKRSGIAKLFVETTVTPSKELSGSQPGQIQRWPVSFRLLAKFPQASMKVFIQMRAPGLTEQKLALWKIKEKQIVPHLFEYETGLDPNKPWPQGPCHEKEAFSAVLNKWVTSPEDHQQLKQLLRASGYGPDWSNNGVYRLWPDDTDTKTHVKHSRSGKFASIPPGMRVSGQWGFESNWSAIQAKLVDTHGYGREVTSFFKDIAIPDLEWAEFAESEAQLCCKTPLESELSTKATLAQLCQNLQAEAVCSTKPLLGASGSQPVHSPPMSPTGAFSKWPHQQEAPAPASPLCLDSLFDGPEQLEAPSPASPLEPLEALAPI